VNFPSEGKLLGNALATPEPVSSLLQFPKRPNKTSAEQRYQQQKQAVVLTVGKHAHEQQTAKRVPWDALAEATNWLRRADVRFRSPPDTAINRRRRNLRYKTLLR